MKKLCPSLLMFVLLLTTAKPQTLSETLKQLKDKLAELQGKLSGKELTFTSVEEFMKANENSGLADCPSLNLNLKSDEIGEEGAQSIAGALETLKNLTSMNLYLRRNNIGNEGAKSIAKALEKFKNLTSLDLNLGSNKIGEEGVKSIANTLKEFENLPYLNFDLEWNEIGEEGVGAQALQKLQDNHKFWKILW